MAGIVKFISTLPHTPHVTCNTPKPAHCLILQSEALSAPFAPPVRKKKWQNQPFLAFFLIYIFFFLNFCPSDTHFAPSMPPQKKLSGATSAHTKFPISNIQSSQFCHFTYLHVLCRLPVYCFDFTLSFLFFSYLFSGVTPMGSGWANPRAPGLRGHPQGAPLL